MWENTVAILKVLKKKNYKAKFSTNSKINKYNLKKNHKKQKKHVEKHCSNP